MRGYKSINIFVFSSFYCNMICFTAMFQIITAEATCSPRLPLYVCTVIGSVVISRECFEHELTWLAFKNISWGPTLSEKDRRLCIRDEWLRCDTGQTFLAKHQILSQASNVGFSSPVSTLYAWNPWDHEPPFPEKNGLHFLTRPFLQKPK